jgi:hypothetical protein
MAGREYLRKACSAKKARVRAPYLAAPPRVETPIAARGSDKLQ